MVDFRPRDRAPAGLPPLPVSMPPAPSETVSAAVSAEAVESAVRQSPFDAPVPPVSPPPLPTTTASRSEPVEVGPPATGSVGLAALLAMALAAFEGIRTWGQEAGPRRVEAAKRKHELALLRAKADLDMAKLAGQAAAARGKSPGGTGATGGSGAKKPSQGGSGGSARPGGSGGATPPRKGATAPQGASGHAVGGKAPKGGKSPSGGSPSPGGKAGNRTEQGPKGGKGADTGAKGNGRTTLGQAAGKAAADRWKGRTPGSPVLSKTNGKGSGSGAGKSGAPKPDAKGSKVDGGKPKVGKGSGPKGSGASSSDGRTTLGQAAADGVRGRWDRRRADSPKPETAEAKSGPTPKTDTSGKGSTSSDGERTTLGDAAADSMHGRWAGREHTPPYTKAPPREDGSTGPTPGASGGSAWGPRASAWDRAADSEPGPIKVHAERMDGGPGGRSRGGQTAAIGTGQRALPRAPQRPAGQRPGTTRKEPTPMTTAPATASAAPAVPVGMAPQHATEVTLDDVLEALGRLTTDGMTTHDECDELATKARRLLAVLEATAADLATTHNVTGRRTQAALYDLTEAVAHLAVEADRMAKAALEAAEVAEAEETAMLRDHRLLADATAAAGLATPSARAHNEE